MSKRAKEKAELIANGIMISVQGRTGRVVYNTKEKSFDHYDLKFAARLGYNQAEKDLALTADEIRLIFNKVRTKQSMYNTTEGCYQEVADWFNKQRKK